MTFTRSILALAAALALLGPPPAARAADAPPAAAVADPLHDFDLFAGQWRTHSRKLKARLAGSQDWVEFDGTQTVWLTLGGAGNVTDNWFDIPDGGAYRGVTLRAFDRKSGQWSIWWLDGRDPQVVTVPQVGGFKDGVGTFLADDSFNGRPIKVRFLWTHVTATTRRWEQAFSADGGKTWETNWTTDFVRMDGPATTAQAPAKTPASAK